jgi:hypothetical protein
MTLLTNKKEIENWLYYINIENYDILDNLTVNVHQKVDISHHDLKCFPIQFGVVNGSFNCNKNELVSLQGAPTEVNGNFSCEDNYLTSLKYCPSIVNGHFICKNNQ